MLRTGKFGALAVVVTEASARIAGVLRSLTAAGAIAVSSATASLSLTKTLVANSAVVVTEATATLADDYAFENVLAIDGTDDYLTIPANAAFDIGTGDFTIGGWINPNAVAGYKALISLGYTTSANGFVFYLNGNKINPWRTGASLGQMTATLSAATWQFVTVSREGTQMKASIGTTQQNLATYSGNLGTSADTILIGKNSSGYNFAGKLDDWFLIKGTAINAGQLAELSNAGVPANPQDVLGDCVMMLKFNETTNDVTAVNDANTGTAGNATLVNIDVATAWQAR